MKFVLPGWRRRDVYTVTDAQRPMSEDISYRQRRYLISMGIRVVALLLAVFLFHGIWRFIAAAIALVVPYFAVVFANGGREPNNAAAFDSFEPNLPELNNLAGGSLATGGGTAADQNAAGAAADSTAAASTAAESTAADPTGWDGAAGDGTSWNGTGGDSAAADRTGWNGTGGDSAAADRAARGRGGGAWDGSRQEAPGRREGAAFLSGGQPDTRS